MSKIGNGRFGNILVNLTGNAVYALGQAVILLMLARSQGAAGVGQYAFALALAAPVYQFADLKLRMVLTTDHRRHISNGRYVALRLLTTTAAAGVVMVPATHFLSSQDATTLAAVCAYKSIESLVDVLYGILQRTSRFIDIAISQLARTVLGTAAIAVALAAGASVATSVAIGAFMTLPALLWVIHCIMSTHELLWPDFHDLGAHIRSALTYAPLGLSVAVGSLTTNAPRYILKANSGDEAVGVYSVLVYALVISGMLAQSFAETSLPRLSISNGEGDRVAFTHEMRRLTWVGASIGLAGVGIAAMAGHRVLNVALGLEFAAQHLALVVLMGAAAVQYIGLFFGVGLTAMRQFNVEFPANAAGLVVVIVVGIGLAGYGVMGAALALLAARIAITALYYAFYRHRLARPTVGVTP